MPAGITATNSVFVHCSTSVAESRVREIGGVLRDLGEASMLFPCCWYLDTSLDVSALKQRLSPLLSDEDALVVIDATNHQAAWRNIRPDAAEQIRDTWANGALPSYIPRAGAQEASLSGTQD